MRKLFFGLESGAQETLDHMDKGIRISDVPMVLQNCRNAGINFHLFSIVGFPEESEESARKTYRFFQDNVGIIDHPGNSFDIHPFGLELRTRYAEEAAHLGVLIATDALAKDFVIGIGNRWINARGLTQAEIDALLNEFHLLLRIIYRKYHACAHQLWPAFEEFAVLYADRYSDEVFPYRTSLPNYDYSDPRTYRLCWNTAALVQENGEKSLCISSRYGNATVDKSTYELAAQQEFCSISQIVDKFHVGGHGGSMHNFLIRNFINDLIEKSLLQLEPGPQSSPGHASML